MGRHQGEHLALGLDFGRQKLPAVGKAQKLQHMVGLVVQGQHGLLQGVHRGVGGHPGHRGPVLVAQQQKAQQGHLPLRQRGEEPLPHQAQGLGGNPPGDGALHPLGQLEAGGDVLAAVEALLLLVVETDGHRQRLILEALGHAAEEALVGAVVTVDYS